MSIYVEMMMEETHPETFKDSLLGITSNPTMKDTKDWISDEDEPLIEDELGFECMSIQLSKEEKI